MAPKAPDSPGILGVIGEGEVSERASGWAGGIRGLHFVQPLLALRPERVGQANPSRPESLLDFSA